MIRCFILMSEKYHIKSKRYFTYPFWTFGVIARGTRTFPEGVFNTKGLGFLDLNNKNQMKKEKRMFYRRKKKTSSNETFL